MIIAYQGVPGAFGHQAARLAFPDGKAIACPSFDHVIATVSESGADAGVLPVENHYAGEVPGVVSLIADSGLQVERLFDLPVRLHLLALPGTALNKITTITSHPMALLQCRQSLAPLNLVQIEASNTAKAAQDLSAPDSGVLASEAAAEMYGLVILQRDLQDDPDNRTTFAVIRRR